MISNLGFPIACVCALGYYFVQKDKSSREDINKIIDNLREDNKLDRELYRDTIDKFDSKLDKFAIALESNNNRLESIEDDIKSIKEKAGV
nr:MAG TPA: YvrJ protein family protein [Caudoviricetes sp.]